jgi:hypothetical protein
MSNPTQSGNLPSKSDKNDLTKKRTGCKMIELETAVPKPPLSYDELDQAILSGTRTDPSLLSLQLSSRMALVFHLAFDGTVFKYT